MHMKLHWDGVFMWRRLFALILAGACVLLLLAGVILTREQRQLSDKLIRLHVVADSDQPLDQAVKLRVRDAVLRRTQTLLANTDQPEAAIRDHLDTIRLAAQNCLKSLGRTDEVQVRFGKELFPTREYDTFSLPAGVYRSLRVQIGSGKGHNWWCVVYPSLCLTAGMDEMELAAEQAGLTDDELRLITEADEGFTVKFKSIELLQKLKNFLTDR